MKASEFTRYLHLRNKTDDKDLERILDKIMIAENLDLADFKYLFQYDSLLDKDIKDYYYLSKNATHQLITEFLEHGVKVICNLTDRDGKIGEEILSIENDFESEVSILKLKGNKKSNLNDKFLYNINFLPKKKHYSLTVQDEYFEKITIDR
jgi:hypothetical protein